MNAADALDEATSVLLLAPTVRDAGADAVASLLNTGEQSHDRVVAVTITQSAERWVSAWRRHADRTTGVSCIDVDSDTRSVSAGGGGCATVPVERVAEPSDLETLGRTASDELERADENGERVGLAIHSVSDLLHQVDEASVFKFVYTLGEVVRRVDGTVYFHLDGDAHDADVVDTFATACDAVVECDGDVTVVDWTDR